MNDKGSVNMSDLWSLSMNDLWSLHNLWTQVICEAWTQMVYETWVIYEARVNCVHSVTYEQWIIWILWMMNDLWTMNDLWRTSDKQCAFYEWFVHSTFYMFFHDVSSFVDLRIFLNLSLISLFLTCKFKLILNLVLCNF